MKKYVIEREIPNVGQLGPEEAKGAAQKSCAVIEELGPDIRWLHSYVTDNKTFCIYEAANEEIIQQHAEKSGFPASVITEVKGMLGPEAAG